MRLAEPFTLRTGTVRVTAARSRLERSEWGRGGQWRRRWKWRQGRREVAMVDLAAAAVRADKGRYRSNRRCQAAADGPGGAGGAGGDGGAGAARCRRGRWRNRRIRPEEVASTSAAERPVWFSPPLNMKATTRTRALADLEASAVTVERVRVGTAAAAAAEARAEPVTSVWIDTGGVASPHYNGGSGERRRRRGGAGGKPSPGGSAGRGGSGGAGGSAAWWCRVCRRRSGVFGHQCSRQ